MTRIAVKPKGELCYTLHVFGDDEICPHYDGEEHLRPKCGKYGKELSWTRSGKPLKCEECLGEEGYEKSVSYV